MFSLGGKGSLTFSIFLLCVSFSFSKDATTNHKPKFTSEIFHGIVEEGSTEITLDPPLFARDEDEGENGQICRFFIREKDIPFTVAVVDRDSGEGVIRPAEGAVMDCEDTREWHFHVRAEDCGVNRRRRSHAAQVYILVNDSNDNAPRFTAPSYETTVNEGVVSTDFLQLEAVDDDCTEANSAICSYEIVTPDVPFTISTKGMLSTTKALESTPRSYELSVVAADCSNRQSELVSVTVNVGHVCVPGWKDIPEKIKLSPDKTSHILAPRSYLETCGNPVCNNSRITTTLTLSTDHIGFGCDRDTYSLKLLREQCSAAPGAVDLLPTPSQQAPWMLDLSTDEGNESEKVFYFNGENSHVTIPEEIAPKNLTPSFSISFWMKHRPRVGGDKEFVLASSDTTGSNKRHYAVYVHNCRITFLLRREADVTDLQYPSEYRWKIDQSCDRQWHRYTFNVQYPQINLFVDAKLMEDSHITNEWPLPKPSQPATLTVGAAWDGASSSYSGHFKGYLAGMSVMPGRIETEKAITCLFACKEGLSIVVGDLPLEVVHLDPRGTQLSLEGNLRKGFSQVLQKVSYYNSRKYPTPGSRDLNIKTTAMCDNKEIYVPEVNTFIILPEVELPTIGLTGDTSVAFTLGQIHAGVKPFQSVRISDVDFSDDDETTGATGESVLEHLDSCQVTMTAALKLSENLRLPSGVAEKYGVHVVKTDEEFIITGVSAVANYEAILRQIIYSNKASGSLPARKMTVRCSELNERFVSNSLEVEVLLIHKKAAPKQALSGVHSPNHFQVKSQMISGKHNIAKLSNRSSSPAVTLVLVVCVGFFMFMIFVGVFRVYTTRRVNRALDDKQDMDWDDGPLNITVNPMDGPMEPAPEDSSDDDFDDDCSEVSSSSEEEMMPVSIEYKGSPLDWDDANLKY